jgi:hypothetical protein
MEFLSTPHKLSDVRCIWQVRRSCDAEQKLELSSDGGGSDSKKSREWKVESDARGTGGEARKAG